MNLRVINRVKPIALSSRVSFVHKVLVILVGINLLSRTFFRLGYITPLFL